MLVVISFLVALLPTWYGIEAWLSNFKYRSSFPWWAVATAGAGTMLLTVMTVSYNTLRASMVKPIQSLRSQ